MTSKERSELTAKYPYLVAYGTMMRSNDSYLLAVLEKASIADAPHDAIHCRPDGTWARFLDIFMDSTADCVQIEARHYYKRAKEALNELD